MKEFLGFKIFSTSAVAGGKNFAYHTSSVGIGINAEVQTEVNYVPQKVSHLDHINDVYGRDCYRRQRHLRSPRQQLIVRGLRPPFFSSK